MPNALAEAKPTPRNALLGALADALSAGRDYADRAQVPQWMPLVGGQGVGSLLLGRAPEELSEWSYGNAPLRVNPLAGRTAGYMPEVKPGRKEGLADVAGLLLPTPTGRRAAAQALLPGGASPLDQAAIVWHGSWHRCDRFDASKIGTVEGAEA